MSTPSLERLQSTASLALPSPGPVTNSTNPHNLFCSQSMASLVSQTSSIVTTSSAKTDDPSLVEKQVDQWSSEVDKHFKMLPSISVATAWLKLAEPAEPSCFEQSQADQSAHDQNWPGYGSRVG
ncbi:hypothetical protein EI94DRAFT_1697338 [Lactarius quietus]|nr:hypothetical protein EI94DRAFT_1697338 [Lactarius quietus]